jgi:hypothetical protein
MDFNLQHWIDQIYVLHDSLGQLTDRQGIEPVANSKAYLELHSYQNPETVMTAYSQGSMLNEVSADQLIAFTKTITEPAQSIAPWTCVRAVIEASALASWLLSPSIDISTRISRSFAFRYEGLSQQEKFLRSIHDNIGLERASAQIDKVEQKAIGLGFTQVLDKHHRRIGIGQVMPGVTDIVGQTLGEEDTYRLLSAMAHAHPWALQKLSFHRVTSEDEVFLERGTQTVVVRAFEKNLDLTSVMYLCSKAIICFARPVWYKFQLFGWDLAQLQDILENTCNILQLKEDQRFWRQNNSTN